MRLGGAFDPRFEPVELDVTVDRLSSGHCVHETYGAPNHTGRLVYPLELGTAFEARATTYHR